MVKNKFKVGDIIKSNCPDGIKKAEVVGIVNERCVVIKPLEHDLACMLRMKIPVLSEDFKKIAEETIVIYRKDNKVVALDKSTGEKAEARCHPVDKFDFHIGAILAFSKLIGEPDKETEETKALKEAMEQIGYMFGELQKNGLTRNEALDFVKDVCIGKRG